MSFYVLLSLSMKGTAPTLFLYTPIPPSLPESPSIDPSPHCFLNDLQKYQCGNWRDMYVTLGLWAMLCHARNSPAEVATILFSDSDQGIFLFDFHFLVFESSVLKIISQGVLLTNHGS